MTTLDARTRTVDTNTLVSLDEIRAAAERIRQVAIRTPIVDVDSGTLPMLSLKCENLQPMGAFKIRGACNMLAQLSQEARRIGVIAYSSGNHGQAVALVAQRFGIPAVIVMPETASRVKVEGVRRYGAQVIFAGRTSADRQHRAEAEAAAHGFTIVPPFDHPWIIAGAGTVALEILEQRPQTPAIYVPMGGGGQIAGIGAAVKRMREHVRVVGVEPAGAARMSVSLAAGHPVTLDSTASIADGLLTLRPGDLTFAHVRAFVDRVVTVDDVQIAATVKWLLREARIVAEPSGAAAAAAALADAEANAVAIVSGGNVDPEDLAKYIV